MISYKEKQERYSKLEKKIVEKYSMIAANNSVIMADILLAVQKDELLRKCNFVFQFYKQYDSSCVNDLIEIVRGDEITSFLDKFSKQDYRFSFFLAQDN